MSFTEMPGAVRRGEEEAVARSVLFISTSMSLLTPHCLVLSSPTIALQIQRHTMLCDRIVDDRCRAHVSGDFAAGAILVMASD